MYKGQGGRLVKLFIKHISTSPQSAEHYPRGTLILVTKKTPSNTVACTIYLILNNILSPSEKRF